MNRKSLLAAALLAGTMLCGPAWARPLEGFWEPADDHAVGHGAEPVLTPAAAEARAKMMAAFNQPPPDPTKPIPSTFGVFVGSRYCLPASVPWNLYQSAPIDISSDARETTMMYEGHSLPWHIYTDGRGHADPKVFPAQENGDSIGHWDGEDLVVDSVNFTPGGMGFDAAPRTAASHMVEVFHVEPDGQHLRATFTVDDPSSLQKPYSWTVSWKRSDPATYAQLWACDPRDAGNSHY